MQKILITGGSGLIGVPLTKLLVKEGFEVAHLTREKNSLCGVRTYLWDTRKNFIEDGALENTSYIIHLAGTNIGGGRWTEERKKSIVKSRTKTAEFLLQKVKEKNIPLKAFISASGTSYYGTVTSDKIFTEEDTFGNDFAAQCVVEWEKSVKRFSEICRVVKLRTGIVLDKNGGALQKMYGPMQWGIGSALGSGKQWMPWIHIDDICKMYLFALKNDISGSYNAVAPEHINNEQFISSLAKVTRHKLILPKVPSFLLRWIFGEMAMIVLEGSRISDEKIKKEGFTFEYPELYKSLSTIYR